MNWAPISAFGQIAQTRRRNHGVFAGTGAKCWQWRALPDVSNPNSKPSQPTNKHTDKQTNNPNTNKQPKQTQTSHSRPFTHHPSHRKLPRLTASRKKKNAPGPALPCLRAGPRPPLAPPGPPRRQSLGRKAGRPGITAKRTRCFFVFCFFGVGGATEIKKKRVCIGRWASIRIGNKKTKLQRGAGFVKEAFGFVGQLSD